MKTMTVRGELDLKLGQDLSVNYGRLIKTVANVQIYVHIYSQ